ncbi:MAG: Rieske (2Fe-2S) protein [Rhabdochlamydiaceae bacterium]
MTLVKVAKTTEFKELEPIIVELGELSVGVYRFNNEYFAYRNWCPHQGGPACEGKVRTVVDYELDGSRAGTCNAISHPKIFCPWHGVAYDLKTGLHKTNKKLRLLPFKVVISQDDVLIDSPRVSV